MTKISPAKIKCKGINQVAIAVKDLELVAKNYWDILGIGPWSVFEWESPLVYNRMYHGKRAWAREKIALTQVGNVQLELVQAVEGPSIYADWIADHGEGLHHLNFLVDDMEETQQLFREDGFFSLQSGKYEPSHLNGSYDYFDTKPLRAIWEPVVFSGEITAKPKMIPENSQAVSPAKIKCKGINQIAIAVKDIELVAKNYWDILGIGPWSIFEWESPLVYERMYHGKKAWGREKIALTQVGNVQLELVQPVDGDSIYADWIAEHGEGLHHLNFLVDDMEETQRILLDDGFVSLQRGKYEPRHLKGAYDYFDIKPLRAIWEPVVYNGEISATPKIFP